MSHTWASSSVTGQNHSLCFPFFFCYAGDHEVQGRLVRYAVEPAELVPAAREWTQMYATSGATHESIRASWTQAQHTNRFWKRCQLEDH